MKLRIKPVSRGLALLLALGVPTVVHADTFGFQTAVQGEASLANLWSFDGADDAARLLDSGPANDPLTVVGPAPSYVAGFGGTSTASNIAAADGYRTLGSLTDFTESFTIEYIFRINNKDITGTYISGALLDDPGLTRVYLGRQQSGKLRLTLGENSNSEDIIGFDEYLEDEWYYAAVNVVEGAGDWVANAWYANLSAGETTLNHSIVDWSTPFNANMTADTLPGNKPLGVGRIGQVGSDNGSGMQGLLDEMAFYDSALTGSDLQGHLNALLGVSVTGDYNSDGVVNAADYTVWRDTENSTTDLRADGDGNGTVNGLDYTVWVNNFGSPPSAGTSVPEPSAVLLVLSGILAWGGRGRRSA